MIKTTDEAIMEENLIKRLTSDISQWTYRPDLDNEAKLWENFKNILERNNKAVLKDRPLTDQEFSQIKNQLNFPNFFSAAKWLVGENGIAKVEVQREDASLGTIRLNVLNRLDVAGGTSVYELINQFQTDKSRVGDRGRFDVTLMINGLPMIQIELKKKSDTYFTAFKQIKNYLQAGFFTGIFSTVQMFVVSNGSQTRYIAAAPFEKLNSQFLTRWVDVNNEPVDNYISFAEELLRIPMAHQMVTDYSVLDFDRKAIILLRPYQIHAIEGVKSFASRSRSGYVWHTTGSGKTLTSYKVSKNLLGIPSIDKTIFIVDRRDLDQQTTSSFESYAELDTIDIDGTESVVLLEKKLASDERAVVITTIQKLHYLMKKAENSSNPKYEKIRNKKLAFVVDECHRAVSPEKQAEINKFFYVDPLWYGFTGTPIFAESKRKSPGDLPETTEEQYGDRIHQYTVKEAIKDQAVLGFNIEYNSTISEDDIVEILEKANPKLDVSALDDISREEKIPKDYYERDDHMLAVIDRIVNKSVEKFGLKNAAPYSALLSVSSIPLAQRYYELFMEVKAGKNEKVKISDKVKKLDSDFPRIAITYSIADNEEETRPSMEKMMESLKDYNDFYSTSFDISNLGSYNIDVNNRLARKNSKFFVRSEQLDLVIVVDRLLTGFDAPSLRILFLDRSPLSPHGLIQAFSRTNRIYDATKDFGQIVTFQKPNLYEEKVKKALVLYSNGGEDFVQAPAYEEVYKSFIDSIERLKNIAPRPEATDDLVDLEDKIEFVAAFQAFDKFYSAARVYRDYEDADVDREIADAYNLTAETIEEYLGRYENIKAALPKLPDHIVEDNFLDIDYEFRGVRSAKIDYNYIIQLIQSTVDFRTSAQEKSRDIKEQAKKNAEIEKILKDYESGNPKAGIIVRQLWEEIKDDGQAFKDKDIGVLIDQRFRDRYESKIKEFASKWAVDKDSLDFVAENYVVDKDRNQLGEKELVGSGDLDEYNKNSSEQLTKLKYRKNLREEYKSFVEDEIIPLMVR